MNTIEEKNINKTQLIDIDKIIKDKNPTLHKRIPKFVIKYLKKALKQDELNTFFKSSNNLYGIDFLKNSFTYFGVKSELFGEENLPENSKAIFVSNHPIGGFDGLLIINSIYSKYGKVKAVVNDLLMTVKNLNEFFLGVNKHGLTAREYIKELNSMFDSDMPVFFFPSGLVSRKRNGKIKDAEWKKTFISRAVKHKRDIIPIYTEGNLTNRFYRISNFRNFLKIKANLEMFYLPDESIKQKGKTIKISIGKAISYNEFNKSDSAYNWAQKVREHVYKVRENINSEFS